MEILLIIMLAPLALGLGCVLLSIAGCAATSFTESKVPGAILFVFAVIAMFFIR